MTTPHNAPQAEVRASEIAGAAGTERTPGFTVTADFEESPRTHARRVILTIKRDDPPEVLGRYEIDEFAGGSWEMAELAMCFMLLARDRTSPEG